MPLLPRISRAAGGVCWLVVSALLAVVLLRLSGWSRGPVAALLLVGLPVVLLPSWLVAAAAAARRDRLLGAAAAVLVASHVLSVLPGVTPVDVPAEAERAPRLRVVTANILTDNPLLPDTAAALRALRPDVRVVAELRPGSYAELRRHRLLTHLPHSTVDGAPQDVEIFSRLPLRAVERATAVPGLPQPRAVIRVGGVDVQLRGAHPLPPVDGYERAGRRSMEQLRKEASNESMPLVVAGDLNADRHHPLFDSLLAQGLRDAAEERGRGLSRTWPQRWPLLALDHDLVRDGEHARLAVIGQREAPLPGSDHLAVVADIAVLAG